MAGLTAARRLQRADIDVTVLERDSRVGGRVRTYAVGGFQIEAGAGFITNYYQHTLRLIGELGLRHELASLSHTGAILRDGRLHPVWPRRHMLTSGLIPLGSKLVLLKAGWPVLRHWKDLDLHALEHAHRLDTASVADFARRRLNAEVADYVLEPVLGGFIYATPERTSQALLLVLLKLGLRLRHLFTLSQGLSRLPEAMAAGLCVRLDTSVVGVRELASGSYDVVAVSDGRERRLRVDGVICATTASTARSIIAGLDPRQKAFLEAVRYAPNATTAVAVDHRLSAPSHAVLFPRRESRYLATAAVRSAAEAVPLPAGQDMVMLYPSGTASGELLKMDDAAILEGLLADLRRAGAPFLPDGSVLFHRVHRWEEAVPEFGVGSVRSLRSFARGQSEHGRLVFAGDYLSAPMIEGAVSSGLLAAERLLRRLGMNDYRARPGS
jgi:protoporphyrinogen/coproporphyrinogen III oxidase